MSLLLDSKTLFSGIKTRVIEDMITIKSAGGRLRDAGHVP